MARWAASFERPALDEGFSVVEEIPFVRRPGHAGTVKGLLLDVDGTLRITRSGEIYPREPDDVQLLPGRRDVLQKWVDDGYRLFFVSNQSGIASGNVSREAADACFQRTVELLGLPVAEMTRDQISPEQKARVSMGRGILNRRSWGYCTFVLTEGPDAGGYAQGGAYGTSWLVNPALDLRNATAELGMELILSALGLNIL